MDTYSLRLFDGPGDGFGLRWAPLLAMPRDHSCGLAKQNKKKFSPAQSRGIPRIELGTSRTRSEHYATKPNPRLIETWKTMVITISFFVCVSWPCRPPGHLLLLMMTGNGLHARCICHYLLDFFVQGSFQQSNLSLFIFKQSHYPSCWV